MAAVWPQPSSSSVARVPEGDEPLVVTPELRQLLGWRDATHLPGALPAAER